MPADEMQSVVEAEKDRTFEWISKLNVTSISLGERMRWHTHAKGSAARNEQVPILVEFGLPFIAFLRPTRLSWFMFWKTTADQYENFFVALFPTPHHLESFAGGLRYVPYVTFVDVDSDPSTVMYCIALLQEAAGVAAVFATSAPKSPCIPPAFALSLLPICQDQGRKQILCIARCAAMQEQRRTPSIAFVRETGTFNSLTVCANAIFPGKDSIAALCAKLCSYAVGFSGIRFVSYKDEQEMMEEAKKIDSACENKNPTKWAEPGDAETVQCLKKRIAEMAGEGESVEEILAGAGCQTSKDSGEPIMRLVSYTTDSDGDGTGDAAEMNGAEEASELDGVAHIKLTGSKSRKHIVSTRLEAITEGSFDEAEDDDDW